MASRSLTDLDSRIRPLVDTLLQQLKEANIEVRVINTLRTFDEQAEHIRNGTSWTINSMHLPQPPDGKSLAIDLAPVAVLSMKNWAPKHPLWWEIASRGKALGLRSGMDWAGFGLPPVGETRPKWDPGHLEWRPTVLSTVRRDAA